MQPQLASAKRLACGGKADGKVMIEVRRQRLAEHESEPVAAVTIRSQVVEVLAKQVGRDTPNLVAIHHHHDVDGGKRCVRVGRPSRYPVMLNNVDIAHKHLRPHRSSVRMRRPSDQSAGPFSARHTKS